MKFHYEKHPEYPDSILIREFHDTVNVNDIINSWEYILKHRLISKETKGIVNDLSQCRLNMDKACFGELMNYLKQNSAIKNIKLAVITNNPNTIVFPMMAEFEEKDFEVKAFSGIDACVPWIMDL